MSILQKKSASFNASNDSSHFSNSTESFITTHRQFIMNVSWVSAALVGLGVAVTLPGFFTGSKTANIWSLLFLIGATINFVTAGFLAKIGKERLGGGLLLLGMLIVSNQGMIFSNITIMSILSVLTVSVGALILLGTAGAYAFASVSCILLVIAVAINRFQPFANTDPAKPGFTDLMFIIIIVFVIIWLATYLSKSFNQANERLKGQASKLQMALADIEEKRALGEDVSRQVFSLTAELNAIASQQASGSQQQVSALTQITVSLEEMTATAQAIASKTSYLSKAAYEIKEITNRVNLATEEVSRAGKNGAIAVENTIKGNLRVSEVHSNLQEILGELAKQQSQIKEVVTTIRGISDETQLLSLNAAIEAAGAGEFGERFAVVAAEVKALAERSIIASRQVNGILGQVEHYIQDASAAAESGHKEIQSALTTAQQSGEVISELMGAIHQTGKEIMQIGNATSIMSEQSKEITVATNQQYNASSQALQSLQSIGTIASQNANGSGEVTKTTRNLEKLSHHLLRTLIGEKATMDAAEL